MRESEVTIVVKVRHPKDFTHADVLDVLAFHLGTADLNSVECDASALDVLAMRAVGDALGSVTDGVVRPTHQLMRRGVSWACACGWVPPLGADVHRSFGQHNLDVSIRPAAAERPS